MDNQPTLDRGIVLPILLGGFSILGIIVVLLIGRSLNSPPPVSASPSATAFQYIYLGTEPAITTPLTEESGIPFPTEPPVEVTPSAFLSPTPAFSLASPTSPSVSTPIILTKPNTTRTSTSVVQRTNTPIGPATSTATLSTPVAANTYDDTDSRLAYSSGWVSQTGVSGAYQGTLHISNANGNNVTFTFTGQEIHLFYQAGPSLGSITVTVDGLGGPAISQAQNQTQIKEWEPDNLLAVGTHLIVITHSAGGSINIDSLVVPAPTATPTRTPTPNPNQ
jgi:cytoskeletal protein RodZ